MRYSTLLAIEEYAVTAECFSDIERKIIWRHLAVSAYNLYSDSQWFQFECMLLWNRVVYYNSINSKNSSLSLDSQ